MNQPNTQQPSSIPTNGQVYYTPVPLPPKPMAPIAEKDNHFAILFFLFGAIWVDFALFGGFRLGFTIASFLYFVLISLYIGKEGHFSVYSLLCGLSGVAGSISFALYSDGPFHFLSFFAVLTLQVLYGLQITRSHRFSLGGVRCLLDVLSSIFLYPLTHCDTMVRSFLKKDKSVPKKKGNGSKIAIGLLFSLPVVCVVVPLLMRTNDYFKNIFTYFDFNLGRTIGAFFLGSILFFFLFSLVFSWKKGLISQSFTPKKQAKGVDPIIIHTFLWVLNSVYVVYLCTQTAYFFSAFGGVLPTRYSETVSDYARRGFFEMCAVVAINLAVLFFTMVLVKKEKRKLPLSSRLLGSFLCGFTILLIFTALSKMFLYIQGFGLTRLRVTTSIFMIFLVFVFIAVWIRLFVRRFPYMKTIVAVFCAIWLTVGFCNIDRVIAQYNVEAYQSNKLSTVDVETLRSLPAALPYLLELQEDDNAEIAAQAHNAVVDAFFDSFVVTCTCEEEDFYYCPHTTPDYYYAETAWMYQDGRDPQIESVAPYEKEEFDFRSYNRMEWENRKLLTEHKDEILTLPVTE